MIDLKGKKAFIIGIGDDQGFGWSIAKALYSAGAEIYIGTWAPIVKIFTQSWKLGKFDESRKCANGKLLEIKKIFPIDAVFDIPEQVPKEIAENKRYKDLSNYTISEVAQTFKKEVGSFDMLVHCLANAPEVKNPLLETSREGYLAAMSSSSYSLISLLQYLGPLMNKEGACVSLSYIASQRAVPKYGGGMSSAKAALESDTKTLAFEVGRKWNLRLNCVSAGPLRSRAAKAIGMIDDMITYSKANAPLQKDLLPEEVANAVAFLLSSLASAITGETLYVDNGLHIMGIAEDSLSLQHNNSKTSNTNI